jgi:pyruvate dehydrogenase E2 component (dihydrolipoamide acetyltransferase)
MPVPIILPKFGFTLETADIVRWLKQEGDTVRAGDPICEVTTDKVNMEVEAPEDGKLFGVLYPEGATVQVTEVIAYVLRPGEARPYRPPEKAGTAREPTTSQGQATSPQTGSSDGEIAITPVAQRVAQAAGIDLRQIRGTGPNNRIMRRDIESAVARNTHKVRATPAARRLAKQAGIDLHSVAGSGPIGRIQGSDVQAAIAEQRTSGAAPAISALPTGSSLATALAPKVVKLEGMRRTIAVRLQQSFQTAPHIYFDAQIDVTAIESLRRKLKDHEEKLSITAILVKACAWTLLRHPWLNATLDGDEVSLWPTANIGVAVALESGLVVPVVRHAERLSMREIQTVTDELAERARRNTLHINDVVDGTFTISNLGMYGVDRFTAIINPPQVAILAVGRTMRQFVPDESDQPMLRATMMLTLSADHRVVDGANAANFLQDLRIVLEEPGMLAW